MPLYMLFDDAYYYRILVSKLEVTVAFVGKPFSESATVPFLEGLSHSPGRPATLLRAGRAGQAHPRQEEADRGGTGDSEGASSSS